VSSDEVDAFVREKVPPEYHPVVGKLRELMREMAPDAKEVISYGIPMFKRRKYLAVISPSKTGITFSFTYGTRFDNKYGLLRGEGKVSRHVKIKSLETLNEEALRYYIQQALEIDSAE
jgi:hypothetical protein